MTHRSALQSTAATRPIVIAHRGASAYRPEHTQASYELAIDMGADFIEPDLVITRDGILIARHEHEISSTTDVASHPEFASRKQSKTVENRSATGWFSEDFTLAEIKTLRARQRVAARDQSFNGQFEVLTLDEILALVKRKERQTGRRIGLYIETKHPAYYRSIGMGLEERLVKALHEAGYRSGTDPIFIQSFDAAGLKLMRPMTALRLIHLVSGDKKSESLTPKALKEITTYADGIGPEKQLIVPLDAAKNPLAPTTLVADAHRAGLLVHPWTFSSDKEHPPRGYASSAAQCEQFFEIGVDGLFSDYPDIAVEARDRWIGHR